MTNILNYTFKYFLIFKNYLKNTIDKNTNR